jgi:hypothetical protein
MLPQKRKFHDMVFLSVYPLRRNDHQSSSENPFFVRPSQSFCDNLVERFIIIKPPVCSLLQERIFGDPFPDFVMSTYRYIT